MTSSYDKNSAKTNATITPYYLLSTVTENQEFIQVLILKDQKEQEDIKDF